MKKSNWKKPYLETKSKTKTLDIPFKSGVYLIKSVRTNEIIYVGYSATQLKKTLYRHFQKWNDSQ